MHERIQPSLRFFLAVPVLLCLTGVAVADWDVQTIEVQKSFETSSLRFRGARPAIAYGDDNIYYAERQGTVWSLEVVDSNGCASGASLAIDPAGLPAIAYIKDRAFTSPAASGRDGRPSASTMPTTIACPGQTRLSLSVDTAGGLALAYIDDRTMGVAIARRDVSGRWTSGPVLAPRGAAPSLAFDASGSAAVSLYDPSSGVLDLASWRPPAPHRWRRRAGGHSFESQVIAILRRHFGEDVDISPTPDAVLSLALGSLAGITEADRETSNVCLTNVAR